MTISVASQDQSTQTESQDEVEILPSTYAVLCNAEREMFVFGVEEMAAVRLCWVLSLSGSQRFTSSSLSHSLYLFILILELNWHTKFIY